MALHARDETTAEGASGADPAEAPARGGARRGRCGHPSRRPRKAHGRKGPRRRRPGKPRTRTSACSPSRGSPTPPSFCPWPRTASTSRWPWRRSKRCLTRRTSRPSRPGRDRGRRRDGRRRASKRAARWSRLGRARLGEGLPRKTPRNARPTSGSSPPSARGRRRRRGRSRARGAGEKLEAAAAERPATPWMRRARPGRACHRWKAPRRRRSSGASMPPSTRATAGPRRGRRRGPRDPRDDPGRSRGAAVARRSRRGRAGSPAAAAPVAGRRPGHPVRGLRARFEAAPARLAEREGEARRSARRGEGESGPADRPRRAAPTPGERPRPYPPRCRPRPARGAEALEHPRALPSKRDRETPPRAPRGRAQGPLSPPHGAARDTEWKRWANEAVQEELVSRAEALRTETNLEKAAQEIRDLDARWKAGGRGRQAEGRGPLEAFQGGPRRGQGEGRRVLRAAGGRACGEPQEEGGALRAGRGRCRTRRVAQDRRRAEAPPGGVEEGRAHGPRAAARRPGSASARPATISSRRREADLKQRKDEWGENEAKKQALCERAEALAESTDWDAAAAELKKLQAEWKAVGPVKKSRSEVAVATLPRGLRLFFDRHKRRDEIGREKSQAEREALVSALEALVPRARRMAPDGLGARVAEIHAAWRQAGPPPRAGRKRRALHRGLSSASSPPSRTPSRAPTSIPRRRASGSRSSARRSRPWPRRRTPPRRAWPSSSRTPSLPTPWAAGARPRRGSARPSTRCARRARPWRACLPSRAPRATPCASGSRRPRAGRHPSPPTSGPARDERAPAAAEALGSPPPPWETVGSTRRAGQGQRDLAARPGRGRPRLRVARAGAAAARDAGGPLRVPPRPDAHSHHQRRRTMRAWYDIRPSTAHAPGRPGIRESAAQVARADRAGKPSAA